MKSWASAVALSVMIGGAALAADAPAPAPAPAAAPAPALTEAQKNMLWAFPLLAAVVPKPPVPVVEGEHHLTGSDKGYTQAQLDLMSIAVDWYPDRHLPMPKIVRDGTDNGGFACGSCHLANGLGHPESSDLVGLSAEYFIKTMAEYKSGARKDPIRMTSIGQATSDQDAKEAAEWFASLKPATPNWVRVVETTTVPKTYLGQGRMRFADPAGGTEPLGNRIIMLPDDVVRARDRDPASGFVAYVPPGSVERGKALVETGGKGKTFQCTLCHGPGLKGIGNIPHIAGNHPIYLVRQLYNFKSGANNGPEAQLMKPVVANLTDQDILDLAAYIGSLPH
jgi:cytochrome c553